MSVADGASLQYCEHLAGSLSDLHHSGELDGALLDHPEIEGDLTSGGHAAAPLTGTPTSLNTTGTIPSTTSGSATVSFHISFAAATTRWTGTAVIDHPGGGFTATMPVHSGAHGIFRSAFVSRHAAGHKGAVRPENSFLIVLGST